MTDRVHYIGGVPHSHPPATPCSEYVAGDCLVRAGSLTESAVRTALDGHSGSTRVHGGQVRGGFH